MICVPIGGGAGIGRWQSRLLLVCCALSSAPLVAQPDSVERWFIEEYVESYLNDAPDFYIAHYTPDVRFVTPGSARLLKLDDLIGAMTVAYVEPWVAKGWSSTAVVSTNVMQLSQQSYLLTAEWSMTNVDGDSVTHCDRPVWHYLITTADDDAPRIFSEMQGDCL